MKLQLLTVTLLLSINAAAQTAPVVAPSAAATEPATAKHGCTKPELPDGSQKISEARMKVFIAGLDGYKDCIQAFSATQQKSAEQQQKAAQAAITAANAAIKEYNDFVEEANRVTAPKDPKADAPPKKTP